MTRSKLQSSDRDKQLPCSLLGNLPHDLQGLVITLESEENWVEGPSPNTATKEQLAEYVQSKTKEYEDAGLYDQDLWEAFKNDFGQFTMENFADAGMVGILNLRKTLRSCGVNVPREAKGVQHGLYSVARKWQEWTMDEINEAVKDTKFKFQSGRILYQLAHSDGPGGEGFFSIKHHNQPESATTTSVVSPLHSQPLGNRTELWHTVDTATKNRFEIHKYHIALNEWSKTTLKSYIKMDITQPTLNHLQNMVARLSDLQGNLPQRFRHEIDLHIKILDACRDIKPTRTVDELLAALEESIRMHEDLE
ncbi:hypothetical protein ACMFMF_001352 [Clarireedia jacksonii]